MSDCWPIFGFRRKSYILLGWSIAVCCLLGGIALGQPYKNAPAWHWTLCLFGVNLGYILADVASDSFMTDLAQREPVAMRGTLQSTYYLVRSLAMAVTGACTSFGFSSVQYGGQFAWGFSLPQFFWLLVVLVTLGMPAFAALAEERDYTAKSYTANFSHLFHKFELDAVWRCALSYFMVSFLTGILNNTTFDIAKVRIGWRGLISWNLLVWRPCRAHLQMDGHMC
jgi:hypothetical protein